MSAGSARANRSSAVRHPPPSVRSRSMRSRRVGLWPGGLGLRLEVEVEVSASARTEAGARGRESGTAIDARSAVAASRRGAGASVTLRCAGYSERFAVGSRKAALHACHTAGGPPLRGELGPAPPPPKSLCPLRELRGLIPLLPPRGVVGRGVMPVCCRTPTTASSYLYSCARREPILGCPSRPRMSLRKPQATRAGLPPGNITQGGLQELEQQHRVLVKRAPQLLLDVQRLFPVGGERCLVSARQVEGCGLQGGGGHARGGEVGPHLAVKKVHPNNRTDEHRIRHQGRAAVNPDGQGVILGEQPGSSGLRAQHASERLEGGDDTRLEDGLFASGHRVVPPRGFLRRRSGLQGLEGEVGDQTPSVGCLSTESQFGLYPCRRRRPMAGDLSVQTKAVVAAAAASSQVFSV
eukprot:CAMPEP_0181348756 /NCGR_PEP_ID=MMETSP1106-20121128/355_1 /TAXON_ID=81844 /ORGANISM="Mantoniella antarctica, Strain SL-175" /LENGTH=408 /DNA_ID=CAMNT_0023461089 /DNA_START=18 /DNA_END=1245 /DNA_ORIENTATION=+